MLDVATHLMLYETAFGDKSVEGNIPPAFHVSDRLHPHLVNMMGTAGYRSLLVRALLLADGDIPWLRSVNIKPDGSLETLDAHQARIEPAKYFKGRVVLLAQLLGLLLAFIGPRLTVRLVSTVWPQISINEMDLENFFKK
jgi:hypothetical protein